MCVGAYIFSASLCLSICFYIFLAAMILMLWKHEWLMQGSRYLFFFLGLGIATAFFDTLTWPAVTFGVPMILYALLTCCGEIRKRVKTVFSLGVSWVFGYLGFWMTKWPISALITGQSTMDTVKFNIVWHTAGLDGNANGRTISLLDALKKLIYPYHTTVMYLVLGVCLILFAVALVRFLRRTPLRKDRAPYVCCLLTLAFACVIPFVWYAVFQSHSIVHNLNYPDRLMLITLWGGMCMIARLFSGAAGAGIMDTAKQAQEEETRPSV